VITDYSGDFMQRNNDAYKYRILEMILQGEETLALSGEDRRLFRSQEEIRQQALFCGVGKASFVEDSTDVPTSRYIEMQCGLMQRQTNDLFYLLDKKAAEREPVRTIGKAPRSYARAALAAYIHAQNSRAEAIERQALFLDYDDGVGYGLPPTPEMYARAEQIVDAHLQAQRTALQATLKAARMLPAIMIAPTAEGGDSFVTNVGGEHRRAVYSLAMAGTRSNR